LKLARRLLATITLYLPKGISMPRKQRRRTSLFLLIAFLVLGIGAVTVEALPECKQVIKTFVDKKVPNKVSKQTLAAWAAWGKGHPDFKPKPRPKYKTTRQEVVKKVDFACEVPSAPVEVAKDEPPYLPAIDVPAPEFVFPEPSMPDVVEIVTKGQPPLPFVPPYSPGIPPTDLTPVPEPSSWVLALTGLAFAVVAAKSSKSWKRAEA
jgi:hypothetical protein